MPPKSNKKRRIDSAAGGESSSPAGLPPIVFTSPGLKADVRINALGQDYHVHSIILKLYSAFFRRFLDSPDKELPPILASFRYEYSSVLDDDAAADLKWVLEPGRKDPLTTAELNTISQDFDSQRECFRKLLCAMYNRPYTVDYAFEIVDLTRLADYYCALPIVSATLNSALLGSRPFRRDATEVTRKMFVQEAPVLLSASMKLRHQPLFRESFIHVVSMWDPDDKISQIEAIEESHELISLVTREYQRLCKRIMRTQQLIMSHRWTCAAAQKCAGKNMDFELAGTMNARFYHCLERTFGTESDIHPPKVVMDSLKELLVNNLVLDQGSCSGEDPFQDRFLCANLSDEDFPWDPEETDF